MKQDKFLFGIILTLLVMTLTGTHVMSNNPSTKNFILITSKENEIKIPEAWTLTVLYLGDKVWGETSTDNKSDSLFSFSFTFLLPSYKATLCLFHQRLKMKFGSFAICEILID